MRLLPFFVFMLFTAVLLMQAQAINTMAVSAATQQINANAKFFLNYRSAVMAYMQQNPSYTGAIPTATLTSLYGQQFSTTFLASAGNSETVSGTGRAVVVYAALPTGTINAILQQSNDDVSIGTSAGTTWTTQANGVVATAQSLPVAVPAKDVVSVFTM